ncbi:MAG: hypothetical protein ACLRI7_15710, partial [Ruthenibacterium lactatiformans]
KSPARDEKTGRGSLKEYGTAWLTVPHVQDTTARRPFQLCFFRSVIGLTIHQWRSLRRNRRCRYCAHSRVFHGRDGDLYFCEAKGKLVYEGLPRWFCQVYTVEEDF